jgi:Fur family transcriptional regulator, ferric uptake regulator
LINNSKLIKILIEVNNNIKVLGILKKNSLSITDGRKKVLQVFLNKNGALAHADIENNVAGILDRVTVYRTLQTFVEKGIIHNIPTTDNSILYALCKDDCEGGHHHDDHVHFICDACAKTICLNEVTIPTVTLPKGFKISQAKMVVAGVCADCV